MSALRAQLFRVSRFSAIGLPMAETSGSSAGVMLVVFIPLMAVGFHLFFFFPFWEVKRPTSVFQATG